MRDAATIIGMPEFKPADAPYPPLPSDRPTRDDPHITYGEWEPDLDAKQRYQGFLPPWLGRFGGVFNIEPRTINGWRRRRYEVWWKDGKQIGRWEWERRADP